MSQILDQDRKEKNKMALSYATDVPAGRTQMLPSFKELLPSYLHEEIDSASVFLRPRQVLCTSTPQGSSTLSTHSPPGQSHPRSSGSAHGPDYAGFPSPSRGSASYARPHGALKSPPSKQSLPTPLSGPSPQFTSPGPSPILPPIRELQSLSDRKFHLSGANPEDVLASRSSSLAPNFPSALPKAVYAYDERLGGSQPFTTGNNATLAYYNQTTSYEASRYIPFPGIQGNSEPDYSPSTQTSPPSNIGVTGDAADARSRRRRGNLPKPVTDILRAWFHDHLDHPYPSEEDKQIFMSRTGLSISQISNWFINARRRQLPALRNQIRNNDADRSRRSGSPASDLEQTSPPSGSPPPCPQ